MLSEDLELVQRRPGPTAFGLLGGAVAGFLVGTLLFMGSGEEQVPLLKRFELPVVAIPTAAPTTPPVTAAITTSDLVKALEAGVAAAKANGDAVRAAVAVDGQVPVAVGADPGEQIPTGTLLRAVSGLVAGDKVALDVVKDSLADPTGCWDRAVLVQVDDPATPVTNRLRAAGVEPVSVSAREAPVPGPCKDRLTKAKLVVGPVTLDGTWTIDRAAAFARALDSGALAGENGSKAGSALRTIPIPEGWQNATSALEAFKPMVLTGWTTADAPLMVSQVAVLRVGDQKVYIAGALRPKDPAQREATKSVAPAAFAALWAPLAQQLAAAQQTG